jgi:hypothetical protein
MAVALRAGVALNSRRRHTTVTCECFIVGVMNYRFHRYQVPQEDAEDLRDNASASGEFLGSQQPATFQTTSWSPVVIRPERRLPIRLMRVMNLFLV